MTATGTEARVCADISARQQAGIAKYGTTVADNPLSQREWIQHAYEECLDQAVYLRRMMEAMDRAKADAHLAAAGLKQHPEGDPLRDTSGSALFGNGRFK